MRIDKVNVTFKVSIDKGIKDFMKVANSVCEHIEKMSTCNYCNFKSYDINEETKDIYFDVCLMYIGGYSLQLSINCAKNNIRSKFEDVEREV